MNMVQEKEQVRNNTETFLSIRDLEVQYTSEGQTIHAVNGVSLELKKGKILGLVGETGAGKTTIAKSILNILPKLQSSITGGQIFIDGEDILTLPDDRMRGLRGNKISMIFQDPMTALNPVMRVVDQIAEGIKQHERVGNPEAEEKAMEMLEMVGISRDRGYEYPHQFSGGMKQRVVIAMALACSPELLLADEPTTALDVTIQAQVLEMIKKLNRDFNAAMILITHDLGVVAEVCDDVAVVYAGEILEYGTLERIFDNPVHPYTKGLFAALPNLTDNVDRLKSIAGLPPDPTNLPAGCSFSPRCPRAKDECISQKKQLVEVEPGHFCRCFADQDQED